MDWRQMLPFLICSVPVAFIFIGLMVIYAGMLQAVVRSAERAQASPFEREDVSAKGIYASEPVRRRIAELEKAGFTRLGEYESRHLSQPAPNRFWLMLDPPGTSSAVAVADDKRDAHVDFASRFEDGAHIETVYFTDALQKLLMRSIDTPDLRFDIVLNKTDVPGLYERHQRHVSEFAARHGEPCRIDSVAQVIEYCAQEDIRFRLRWTKMMRNSVRLHQQRLLFIVGIGTAGFVLEGLQAFGVLDLSRPMRYGIDGVLLF